MVQEANSLNKSQQIGIYLESVADGESDKTSVDSDLNLVLVVVLDDGKQGSKQDDQVSHELQTNGQPSVGQQNTG